jgi:hypothetical protein
MPVQDCLRQPRPLEKIRKNPILLLASLQVLPRDVYELTGATDPRLRPGGDVSLTVSPG